MPRQEVRPKVVATAFKLAEDLDLICENEDTDKAVAQFFKSVPKVLRQLGKDVSIIWQELGDEYGDCPVPDFGLPGYAISFTIGGTMKDRIGNNPLLAFEYLNIKNLYKN